MNLRFRFVSEPRPGMRWSALFRRSWPAYRSWFLSEGESDRPDLATCRKTLRTHMPELIPVWDELTDLADGDVLVARMLTLVDPPRYMAGCSQAVWTRDEPFLVRNYDYHPEMCEGTFLMTRWTGTRVLASSDCLWGALDGMNEHGVCVALSFGGRPVVGRGFGIPVILRYVLELARDTAEAVQILTRIPSHMAYNVSVLDRRADNAVVHLSPDRPPLVTRFPIATNHQQTKMWDRYAEFRRAEERETFLAWLLADPEMSGETLTRAFLDPPLFTDDYRGGFGTLYTAQYHPCSGTATFLWPGRRRDQSLTRFEEDEIVIDFETSNAELRPRPRVALPCAP